MGQEITLAQRLGRTAHISPLRMKLLRLWKDSPDAPAVFEDWLVDVANARGARVVMRESMKRSIETYSREITTEELVVGLLLPQNLDRPQILRLAAQFISRGSVDFQKLVTLAVQERVGFMLAELARQACQVDARHSLWSRILEEFGSERVPRSSLLHYTRLAEPIMPDGRVSDGRWTLVS